MIITSHTELPDAVLFFTKCTLSKKSIGITWNIHEYLREKMHKMAWIVFILHFAYLCAEAFS